MGSRNCYSKTAQTPFLLEIALTHTWLRQASKLLRLLPLCRGSLLLMITQSSVFDYQHLAPPYTLHSHSSSMGALSYAQNCQSCENLTFHTTVCYLKTEISLWQMTPWLSFDTWWRRCQSLTSFKTVCFLHQLCFVLPVCAYKLSGQLICMREVLCSRGLQLNWIKPFENLEWEALSNISLIKLCKWPVGWRIGLMVYCAVSN